MPAGGGGQPRTPAWPVAPAPLLAFGDRLLRSADRAWRGNRGFPFCWGLVFFPPFFNGKEMERRRGVRRRTAPPGTACTSQRFSPSPPPHTLPPCSVRPFALKHRMCFILKFLWERYRSQGEQQLLVRCAGIWRISMSSAIHLF